MSKSSRGAGEIQVIATPGHLPDSVCLCLFESGVPVALFSGDTLFADDVGRPDLRDRELNSQEPPQYFTIRSSVSSLSFHQTSKFTRLSRGRILGRETNLVRALHDNRPGSRNQTGRCNRMIGACSYKPCSQTCLTDRRLQPIGSGQLARRPVFIGLPCGRSSSACRVQYI